MKIKAQEAFRLFEEEAKRQGVDPVFARAVLIAENSSDGTLDPSGMLDITTTSPAGAYGLGQVMPGTRKLLMKAGMLPQDFAPDTPQKQAQEAIAAIKEKMMRAGVDPLKLAVHYNGSSSTFKKFVASGGNMEVLPQETQQYLRKVAVNHPELKKMLEPNNVPDPRGRSAGVTSWQAPNSLPTTRTSISMSTVMDPLGLIDKALAKGQTFFDRGQEIIEQITGVNQAAAEDVNTISQAADAKSAGLQAKVGVEAKKQAQQLNIARQVLQAFGADVSAPGSELSQLQQQVAVGTAELTATQKELDALRSVEFADNPLGWLVAQFKLEGAASRYNNAAQKVNAASRIIGTRQQQAAAQIGLQPTGDLDTIKEEEQANLEIAAADAVLAKRQFVAQNRTAMLNSLNAELDFHGRSFSTAAAMVNFATQRLQLSEHEAAKGQERMDLAAINVWHTMQGLPEMRFEEFKNLRPEMKQELITRSRNAVKSGTIGTSIGDSLTQLLERNALPAFMSKMDHPEAQKFWSGVMQAAVDGTDAYRLKNPKVKSDLEAQQKLLDQAAANWRKEAGGRDYTKLSKDNPLRIRVGLAAEAPALKDNSVAQYIRSLPQGGYGIEEKDVISYAVAQVAAKTKTPAQAAQEVSEFFRVGTTHQYAKLGLKTLGFNVANPSKGVQEYPITGDLYGAWARMLGDAPGDTERNYQAYDPASMENMISRYVAQSLAAKVKPLLDEPLMDTAQRQLNIGAQNGLLAPSMPSLGMQMPEFVSLPSGAPSIYAGEEEWRAYRERQAQQQGGSK